MQIQPNFTSKYKYSKNAEERKHNLLKETCKSSVAVCLASGTYGVLEAINKNSIANKNNISTNDLKALAKSGLKRNIFIGLAVGIAGALASEHLLNMFTRNETDDKYSRMKNLYKVTEGLVAGFVSFGLLETFQKFSIAKSNNTQIVDEIASTAKKGFQRNLLWGLAAAASGYLIAWPCFKLFEPTNMKLYEWADKQNRIAEKAEELIKQEDAAKKA